MFDNFSKTYSDRVYKYTTIVRHKGTVIAFALDDKRRIVYSVLNLAGDPQTSVDAANDKSPFDKDAWAKSPTELIFPTELAEVGFGIADQTMMPVVKGTTPAPVGTMLPAPNSDDAKQFNYFLSTTERLSADAPFQVLSDGQFLHLFRQAIAADHADMVLQRDKDGKVLLVAKRDAAGNVVKDAAGKVTDSWIDSFNIERAADGLFNTLGKQIYTCVDHPDLFAGKPGKCALPGKLDERLTCEKTLIPRLVTSGYAESALKFAQATNIVELANAVTLGTKFTLEAWIKPEAATTTTPQVLCGGIAPPLQNALYGNQSAPGIVDDQR